MSTANVYLLAELPPTPPGGLASKPEDSSKKRKLRVLVIDDERLIADTTAEILNVNGFEATPIYNGRGAVEAMAQFCPDVVITDVIMPEMNGVELAKKITGRCPDNEGCSHFRTGRDG